MTEKRKEERQRQSTSNHSEFPSFAFKPLFRYRIDYWAKKLEEKYGFAVSGGDLMALAPLESEANCNDYIPINANELLLFTIFEKKFFVHLGLAKNFGEDSKTWKYSITPLFFEPFRAFCVKDDFYFVTKSGSVFVWRRPGKADEKMETVWSKKSSPVQVVFEELDGKKTYAFTQTAGAQKGEGLFFELAAR
jgi:hypothetical protein